MLFAELTYTLATEEAERIGVDHVARMTATGSGENSTGNGGWRGFLGSGGGRCGHTPSHPWSVPHPPAVAEHLIAQHSAIKMLHSRVKLILEYVKASEAGRIGVCLALYTTFPLSWGSDSICINTTSFCAFRRGPL